ncbi:MAG: ClcB-like voltage-gated chloride channel protein [Myxococcales bacterium]
MERASTAVAAKLFRWFRYALAILAVGVLAAGFAIAFRLALHHGVQLLTGKPDVLAGFSALPIPVRIGLPALGGLCAAALGLVAARRSGGHGVAEILESVALGRGHVNLLTVVWKGAASLVALASGGSIGREGSIIQFGAGAGAMLGRRLGLADRELRLLAAAGTAAGFAAAYNTPIAAVLFVVEIVTGVLGLDVVVPASIATAVATTLTRLAIGGGPLYGQRAFALVSQDELAAYLAVGLLAGVAGAAFMAGLSLAEEAFARLGGGKLWKGALGGLVVGLIAIRLPQVTGNGYEVIQLILDGKLASHLLALLLVAKACATIASVSSGSPGGVFTPSMFLGAALGGLVGNLVPHVAPLHATAGVAGGYALVGMAGIIAATTHAPLMAAMLGFELSGDYSVVVPLLLAASVAALVSRFLRADSVYTGELRRRGISWRGSLTERLARAVQAHDLVEMNPPQVEPGAPVAEVLALLSQPDARVVYVAGEPLRAIDLGQAKKLWEGAAGGQPPPTLSAGELAHEVDAVRLQDTLLDLSEKLWATDWGEVPVVDPGPPPRLIGVVTRRALLGAMDREILRRDVLLTRVVRFDGEAEASDFLELPAGCRVQVLRVPPWMVGGALDPAALRTRFGVTVLAVRRGTLGRAARVIEPDKGYRLHARDRLHLIGTPEAIEGLRLGVKPPAPP